MSLVPLQVEGLAVWGFISLSLSLHVPSVLMVVQPQAVFSSKHTHTLPILPFYKYSHAHHSQLPSAEPCLSAQKPHSLLLGPPSALFLTETDSEDAGLDAPYSCHLHTPYACFNTPLSIDMKNVTFVLPEGMRFYRTVYLYVPQTLLTLEHVCICDNIHQCSQRHNRAI